MQETFELFHETLYLAVRMVDRYLNKKNVRKLHLQLLGVTAIFLASKMEVSKIYKVVINLSAPLVII